MPVVAVERDEAADAVQGLTRLLAADAVRGLTRLLAGVSDVVLVVGRDGRILRADVSRGEALRVAAASWCGRRWAETVSEATRGTLEELLAEVGPGVCARPRQLDHRAADGRPLPVRYAAMGIGESGPLVAAGRDLGALSSMRERLLETEQAMERDYWRLRQAEALHRLMFRTTAEASFVVDPDSRSILDVNLAAARLLDAPRARLVGRPATLGLRGEARLAVEALLEEVRSTGGAPELRTRLPLGDGEHVEVRVSAVPFRSDGATLLLMRVRPASSEGRLPESGGRLSALVERIPDAVVITDAHGKVLRSNPAFLALSELACDERVRGRSLSDWLGRPGSDLPMILALVKSHGSVAGLQASLCGELGARRPIEVSAAGLPVGDGDCVGFVLRGAQQLAAPETDAAALSPGAPGDGAAVSVGRLEGLVGRVSLPELIRDTTERVERDFIRAALEAAGGNRTTAAELLGLSRQSLYVKLRRQGLRAEVAGPAR